MSDEHREETASLYVLGVLTPEEALAFERQLAADPTLARLVDELREGAAAFVVEAPTLAPPAHVREQLLERIKPADTVVAFPPRTRHWAWMVAAGFAVLAAVLGVERLRLRATIATLEERNNLSELRIATLTSLVASVPDSVAAVIWDAERQRGLIDVRNLPQPQDDQDYQLWVIDPQYDTPVSAGVLQVREGAARVEFTPTLLVYSADKFAISVEPKGGSPRNTGPIVLISH